MIEVEALLVGDPERPVADPRLRSDRDLGRGFRLPPEVASVESSLPQQAEQAGGEHRHEAGADRLDPFRLVPHRAPSLLT
ncbi:MAG: hypothetical protein R2691_00200 [Solirubrobacterales bacterium]